jgi:putative hydrolase of the HAD superfamily
VAAALSDDGFEAVVFDLFGTLVPEFPRTEFYDSVRGMASILGADEAAFLEGWNETAIGRQTGEYRDVADNVLRICEALGVEVDDDSLARALDLRAGLYRRWFHSRPGALETLTTLKEHEYPIGLISMCAPDTPALWRASELASFVDVEVFSSEVGLRKPDAAIYRYTCERLGVDPRACLFCGDGSYGELTGAAAVGMTPYLIADPTVIVEDQLRPEGENWNGASVADLRDLLPLLPPRE